MGLRKGTYIGCGRTKKPETNRVEQGIGIQTAEYESLSEYTVE
jgi:hypothetical protein